MRKYHNTKIETDGIVFDSKREMGRYRELSLLERAGKIQNLSLQPEFLLQEGFTDSEGTRHRQIKYYADFTYEEKGKTIVEDVKAEVSYYWDANGKKKQRYSGRTKEYMLKKKMLLYKYRDIVFRET